MKKFTCISLVLMFVFFAAQGQNDCINAVKYYPYQNSIPLPGTISPPGPDLGCLSITGRQVWNYIPVCKADYYISTLNFYNGSYNPTIYDSVGVVFYGTFNQKVTNCADLNVSTIKACYQFMMPNFNSGTTVISINDSIHQGNYYYILMTFTDSVPSWFDPHVEFIPNLPIGFYDCFECNNNVSVLNQNDFCLVTVDTAINKCVLTWQEFPASNLLGYKIFRETTLTGVYDSITTIPVGSLSTYTDLTSSPAQHNERYKVIGTDSCGQSYPLSTVAQLTSIHLISFAGGNNQANLIWNNIYTNNNFIPQYYIHRNNNGAGWQLIDSIGVTLPTITYTDIFAPAGTNQYTVELVKTVPCIPMRTSSTPYQSVFSNTSIAIVTGTEEFSGNVFFRISPNPANEYSVISGRFGVGDEIRITDVLGKTLFTKTIAKKCSIFNIQCSMLASGMYFVTVSNEKERVVKKLVRQ